MSDLLTLHNTWVAKQESVLAYQQIARTDTCCVGTDSTGTVKQPAQAQMLIER